MPSIVDFVRNLVADRAPVDGSDRYDRQFNRIDVARYDCLQRGDKMRGRDDRVPRLFRLRAVPGVPIDCQHYAPALRHRRAVVHANLADRHTWPVVVAKESPHRKPLDSPSAIISRAPLPSSSAG